MKKRVLAIFLMVGLVLGGCSNIDYTDSSVYLGLVQEKVNELDPNFFTTLQDFATQVGVEEEFKTFKTDLQAATDVVIKIKGGTKETYNTFKEKVDSIDTLGVTSTKIQEKIDEYSGLSADKQAEFQKKVKDKITGFNTRMETIVDLEGEYGDEF